MSSEYLIMATFAMAAVTLLTRATPILLPKTLLDTRWLRRLNESLPLSVMVLLILTSLSYHNFSVDLNDSKGHLLLAQIGALLLVLWVYHMSRQLLLSMILGIAAINALLWLLERMLR